MFHYNLSPCQAAQVQVVAIKILQQKRRKFFIVSVEWATGPATTPTFCVFQDLALIIVRYLLLMAVMEAYGAVKI